MENYFLIHQTPHQSQTLNFNVIYHNDYHKSAYYRCHDTDFYNNKFEIRVKREYVFGEAFFTNKHDVYSVINNIPNYNKVRWICTLD